MKKLTKIIAMILCVMMIATSLPLATMLQAKEIPTYPLDASKTEDEYSEAVIYAGTSEATVNEEDAYFTFPVYRAGDISQPASVKLVALDTSALYGVDYEIVADDVLNISDGKTLLEKYYETGETVDLNDVQTAQLENGDDVEIESTVLSNADGAEDEESIISTLSAAAENLGTDALDYSAYTVIFFEAGQSEATVTFRIFDDSDSEGQEMFSLVLCDETGATVVYPYETSIVIDDNEPQETSKISFTESAYTPTDGTVTLTIKREDAEYSMADFTLATVGDTAVAGTNYEEMYETVVFSPFETEKQIELRVSGSGCFSVIMSEFTACEAGDITEATITIDGVVQDQPLNAEKKNFSISLNNKTYKVEYEGDDPVEGKIIDDSVTPPVCVGKYYFPTNKHFVYDKKNTRGVEDYSFFSYRNPTIEYVSGVKTGLFALQKRYGFLDIYCRRSGATLYEAYTYSNDYFFNSIYFQSLIPEWNVHISLPELSKDFPQVRLHTVTTEKVMVSSRGTRALTTGRQFDTAGGIKIDSSTNKSFRVEATADATKAKFIKGGSIYLYGFAGIYKQFRINVGTYPTMTYRLANGGSISSMPFRVQLPSGIKDPYGRYHTVYMSENKNESNFVFQTSDIDLNGHYGMFGEIAGYTIDVNTSEPTKRFSLDYPSDFICFINTQQYNKDCPTKYGDATETKKKIDSINNRLDIVAYDDYFVDWVLSRMEEKGKYYEYVENGQSYYELKFNPIFKYSDVQVTVYPPKNGNGRFADTTLSAGKTLTFHAGDELNLKSVAEGTGYTAVGYEYSLDGIVFNTIRSSNALFLEKFNHYYIRPNIEQQTNYIEIRFASKEAESKLEIQGLLSKTLSESVPEYKGKNILLCNPNESDPRKAAEPTVGKDYLLNVVIKNQTTIDYIYRTIITDKTSGEKFNTQMLPVIARGDSKDNVYIVDIETVRSVEVPKRTITGILSSDSIPLRDTGVAAQNKPVSGYNVIVGTSQTEINKTNVIENSFSTTDQNGKFELKNVAAKSGDKIPILVTNGFNAGQRISITVGGSSDEISVGNQKITYPYDAPVIKSISYRYADDDNNLKYDTKNSKIKILDDDLDVTLIVDDKGRDITQIELKITNTTGTTWSAWARNDSSNPGVFRTTIKKMVKNLYSGDTISARIVDSSKANITVNGKLKAVDIEYPVVDTGLTFYVENTVNVPQNINLDASQPQDIPVVGTSVGKAQSGVISWDRTDWGKDSTGKIKGYTYSMNVGLGYDSTLGKLDKMKDFDNKVAKSYYQKLNPETKHDALNAELITWNALNGVNVSGLRGSALYNDLLKEKEENIRVLAEKDKNAAKNSTAELNSTSWKVEATYLCTMNFVYNPARNQYVYYCSSTVIGATLNAGYTRYRIIHGIPFYLFVTGTIQFDSVISYKSQDISTAISSGDFKKRSDVASYLTNFDGNSNLVMTFKGKVALGVGMNAFVGVKGAYNVKLQKKISIKKRDGSSSKPGALLNMGGSIETDLVVTTLELRIVEFTKGWGVYSDKTGFDFFGGLKDKTNDTDLSGDYQLTDVDGKIISQTEDGEVLSLKLDSSGTSDMSNFGTAEERTEAAVRMNSLLENAADRTRAQIAKIDDDTYFLTFVGSRGDESEGINAYALYYAVYKNGSWSEPKLLNNSGTFDSQPSLCVVDKKVYISYVNATKQFTESDDELEQLRSTSIAVACYDSETDTMKESKNIAKQTKNSLEYSPSVTYVDNEVCVLYSSVDISSVTDIENITDAFDSEKCKLNSVLVRYNKETDEWKAPTVIFEEKISENSISESFDGAVTKINGINYYVGVELQNTSGSSSLEQSNKLFLYLYDLDNGIEYAPIPITDDTVSACAVKITEIDGELVLTFLSGGSKINLVSLTGVLSEMLTETTEPIYRADAANKNWYVKSAAELGMDEETYEYSVNKYIAENDITYFESELQQTENEYASLTDYTVASNGGNIYILYTDFIEDDGTVDESKNIREIYACCFYRSTENNNLNEEAKNGFSDSVQLTNCKRNIDGLSAFVDKDDKIHVIADVYDEKIDEATSKLITSATEMTEFVFDVSSELEATNLTIDYKDASSAVVTFDVENEYLGDCNGYSVKVEYKNAGETTELFYEESNLTLEPNETHEKGFEWNLPQNLEGGELVFTLTDKNGNEFTTTEPITTGYETTFENVSTELEDGKIKVEADIKNIGNIKTEQSILKLGRTENDAEISEVLDTLNIRELAPYESEHISLSIPVSKDDFDKNATVNLMMSNTVGDNEIGYMSCDYIATSPEIATLNGGEAVELLHGASKQISAQAYPWGEIAGDVIYFSEDYSIASIDENGVVEGTGIGSTTLYAYYPEYDLLCSTDVEILSHLVDVQKGDWFYEGVASMFSEGYMLGIDETHFSPNSEMTRGMFCEVLFRMEGNNSTQSVMPFTDVNASAYYADAVMWAYTNGLVAGISKTEFAPDEPITREQAAVILQKYYEYADLEYTHSLKDVFDFDDCADISEWAVYSMNFCVKAGLFCGDDSNRLLPKKSITRAEAAVVLANIQ